MEVSGRIKTVDAGGWRINAGHNPQPPTPPVSFCCKLRPIRWLRFGPCTSYRFCCVRRAVLNHEQLIEEGRKHDIHEVAYQRLHALLNSS